MRVFISRSSKDKPSVIDFATALRPSGVDAWLDVWEIAAGNDIVAEINRGLEDADAAIIVFSQHTNDSPWVGSEISALIHARITEGMRSESRWSVAAKESGKSIKGGLIRNGPAVVSARSDITIATGSCRVLPRRAARRAGRRRAALPISILAETCRVSRN